MINLGWIYSSSAHRPHRQQRDEQQHRPEPEQHPRRDPPRRRPLLFSPASTRHPPCCLKHYIVKLHLLKKETKAGKRSKDDAIPNPVVIKMNTQPDEKYIMEYVYGHLADKSMPYYHTASHLVEMGMMVPMEMRELDKVKLR